MEDDIFEYIVEDIEDITLEEIDCDLDEDEINMIFTRNFLINPTLWTDSEEINRHINIDAMHEVKYVRDDLIQYDSDLNSLPTNGGLYFFFIKPPILFGKIQYLVYIGRARGTDSQNLKKRCREYFYDFRNVNKDDSRTRKIRRMIKRWGKYLYLQYIEISDNNLIDSLESLLINNIRPPFNSSIPEKKYYQPAVAAFQ